MVIDENDPRGFNGHRRRDEDEERNGWGAVGVAREFPMGSGELLTEFHTGSYFNVREFVGLSKTTHRTLMAVKYAEIALLYREDLVKFTGILERIDMYADLRMRLETHGKTWSLKQIEDEVREEQTRANELDQQGYRVSTKEHRNLGM